MNYLAHIFLSGNDDNLIIGNFIADFIRGNQYKHLPVKIQNGILLHRKIDSFTDQHVIVRKSKRRLHSRYGHYSGIIIDILYDFFLAKNWQNYSNISLIKTESNFVKLMNDNVNLLPEKVKKIIPFIEKENWLSNYATYEGIEKSLIRVNKRTENKSKMHLAINDLKLYETELENDFNEFFKHLIVYSQSEILKINNP